MNNLGTRRITRKVSMKQVILMRLLVMGVILSILSYVFMVNIIAVNGASYEKMLDRVSVLESEVGELELSYIEKNKEINQISYLDLGLVKKEDVKKVFVQKDNSMLSLSN